MNAHAPTLLSLKELCEELKLSPKHVRKLRNRRLDPLPSLDLAGVLRFDQDAVTAWLERQAPPPDPGAPPAGRRGRIYQYDEAKLKRHLRV